MNEIWNLFKEAKNAAIKILTSKDTTNKELEALFKAYWYSKTINKTDSGTENLLQAMELAIDSLISYFSDILKDWRPWFLNILIEDILNWKSDLESTLENPYQLLLDKSVVEIEDTDTISELNNLLRTKINENLINSDFSSCFGTLNSTDLQKILNGVKSMNNINSDVKEAISIWISNALFWKIAPELENISEEFRNKAQEAISNWDSSFDAWYHKKQFIEQVIEIENNEIVRWSSTEELLKKCKSSFEKQFDDLVCNLIDVIITWKLTDELENFESEWEIDDYIRHSKTTYDDIRRLLKELNNWKSEAELRKKLDKKIEDARITCKSKPPKVRIITDSEWNQYAIFKNETFPIFQSKPKEPIWRIEPKKLPDGNILITFKDSVSGKVIEPKGDKTLRDENPYEMSRSEYKELSKQIKSTNWLLPKIRDIREKLQTTTDEEEKKKLKENLKEYIEEIPHFVKVREKLKIFDKYLWDYKQDKVPNFDPDTIKITPDIMENLREIAECSKTMLIWEKDALIIEWEAWVWKNVLIDIFAHFTNRPVFVFACGKKTDNHDLNYQWILDENGSKKLNSKVYEAIRTPWAILVLDEINTLDAWVIKSLNALFDKRKALVTPEAWGKDTRALQDVLLFGTMNPIGYSWTQQLPQDVASRFHFIEHDYDWIFDKDWWVSYSDALRTYWNVNYFWKLLTWNGMRKQEIELYEEALLDKKLWNKLSKEKQELLENFKPISDSDFIWAWNQLFNMDNESEVISRFWDKFVEWMNDIYTIVLYSNYIRLRHKVYNSRMDGEDFPWSMDDDELFEEKSFSPRLVIQALEQLHNGNEIKSAKQAVVKTYIQQVSDVDKRTKIIQFFNRLSKSEIEKQLKNDNVKRFLFASNY